LLTRALLLPRPSCPSRPPLPLISPLSLIFRQKSDDLHVARSLSVECCRTNKGYFIIQPSTWGGKIAPVFSPASVLIADDKSSDGGDRPFRLSFGMTDILWRKYLGSSIIALCVQLCPNKHKERTFIRKRRTPFWWHGTREYRPS